MTDIERKKALQEITTLLDSGAIPTPVTYVVADELAKQHGLTRRAVLAHVVRSGFEIKLSEDEITPTSDDEELVELLPTNQSPRHSMERESQYGPLQGIANVAGGCATVWGWLFLGLAFVLLWMLITGRY